MKNNEFLFKQAIVEGLSCRIDSTVDAFEGEVKCTKKHIKTIETRNLCESAKNGGCGECQTSCQSACKTSCGIANQACENNERK